MSDEKSYMYKTTIKRVYGLTDRLIAQLGEPDKVVSNPHHRASTASLYLIERVEDWIENHPDEVEAARARSRTGQRAAEAKRLETLVWANRVDVVVYKLVDRKQLRRQTIDAAIAFAPLREFTMTEEAIIAFVRHNKTNYHELLADLSGRVGCVEAYAIIRRRVDDEITRKLDGGAK